MKTIEEIREKIKAAEKYGVAKTEDMREYLKGFLAALRWVDSGNK